MSIPTDVSQAATQSIEEWDRTLQGRNHLRSTYFSRVGHRGYYTIFHPIDRTSMELTYDSKIKSYLLRYSFEQENHITGPFPSSEEAKNCDDFQLRDTRSHKHYAVYRGGKWEVLERSGHTSGFKKSWDCDRFDKKAQEFLNDSNCRENDEVALALAGNDFLIPERSEIMVVPLAEFSGNITQSMSFLIYDFPDDDRSVTISFDLRIRLRIEQEDYLVVSSSDFTEFEDVVAYEKRKKGPIKNTLLTLLKGALAHCKSEAEDRLGRPIDDARAFPSTKKDLSPLLTELWKNQSMNYV